MTTNAKIDLTAFAANLSIEKVLSSGELSENPFSEESMKVLVENAARTYQIFQNMVEYYRNMLQEMKTKHETITRIMTERPGQGMILMPEVQKMFIETQELEKKMHDLLVHKLVDVADFERMCAAS